MLVLCVCMMMCLLRRLLIVSAFLIYTIDTINFRWDSFRFLVPCFHIQAQAIMLLAGNGSSAAQSKSTPVTQAQAPMPRPCAADGFVGNNSSTMSPCSGFPGPISVTSHVSLQPGEGSSGTNDLTAVTRVVAITSSNNQPERPRVVNSVGSAATSLIPAGFKLFFLGSIFQYLMYFSLNSFYC